MEEDKLIHVNNPDELIKKYNSMKNELATINSNVHQLNEDDGKFELKPSKFNIKVGIVQPTENVEKLLLAYMKLTSSPQKGQSSKPIVGGGGTMAIFNKPWTFLGTSIKSTAFIRKETTLKGFVDSMESKGPYELSITFFSKSPGDQLIIQQVLTNKSTYFISSDKNNNNGTQFGRRGTFYADFRENDHLIATYNSLMPKIVWREGYIQYSIKIGNDYFLLPTTPSKYNIDMTNITGNLPLRVNVEKLEKLSLSVIAVPPSLAILEIVMVDI
jgi:hypothetical protein